MGARLLDALTHSGPGYELNHENTWTESRSTASRYLDALTHSGPGYSLPSATEIAEIAVLKRQKLNGLNDALLEGFELFFYAKGHLEAMERAETESKKREQLEAAITWLRLFLRHVDGPMDLALMAARESLGPLDLRSKLVLRRLDGLFRRLKAIVEGLLGTLEGPGKPRSAIANRSQAAVKRAARSMEVLCHAAAR
jgi:hypothetical protein